MNPADREMRNMVEMELSALSIFSMCANTRFSKLICPDGRIRSRYFFYFVSSAQRETEKTIRSLQNKRAAQKGFKAIVVALAYPDGIRGLDESVLSLVGEDITVIDASGVPMQQELNEKYALGMVYYNLAFTGHAPDAEKYRDRAYEELRPWTEKLLSSPVVVHDREHPEGEVCPALSLFYERVIRDIFEKYPCSPDTMGLDGFFFLTLGSRFYVRDGFYGKMLSEWTVTDPDRTPDRLFDFVWGDDSAWYDPRYAGEKVVILKQAFDRFLETHLENGEKVSFRQIFEYLREPPYGLLPNHIGAILMGMFFRTWRNRGLIWTNGFQQDVLDDSHLLAMVENGVHNQRTFYRNSLPDCIMLPDRRTSVLTDAAADIFGLDTGAGCFLSDLRSALRFAMEALPYPFLSVQYARIGSAEREAADGLLRFVRLTSDDADRGTEEELVDLLSSAFQRDTGLGARIKDCLYGDPLREGFVRMLEENGIDPAAVTAEKLRRVCGGRQEWKWIWREESIIRQFRAMTAYG